MKKQLAKYFKYTLLLAVLTVGFKVFFPKTYAVEPFQNRANTQYWQLPTGSRIGYTLIHAIGEKKTYPIIFLQGHSIAVEQPDLYLQTLRTFLNNKR